MQTDLETRLANLENSVRNWKRFSALVAAVAAAVCVAGWRSGPGPIEATELRIVDKLGIARITADVTPAGQPRLHLGAPLRGWAEIEVGDMTSLTLSGSKDNSVVLDTGPYQGGAMTLLGKDNCGVLATSQHPQLGLVVAGATVWKAP